MLLWTSGCRDLFEFVVLVCFTCIPRMELLSHIVVLFTVYWETSSWFSPMAAQIYILADSIQRFFFLHVFAVCYLLSFWWWPFWQVWGDISLWFWFAFPWWFSDVKPLYMCLLAICISSLEKLCNSFALFLKIELFDFLMLSCISSLYILNINPLSIISFTNIISHSVGCLFHSPHKFLHTNHTYTCAHIY